MVCVHPVLSLLLLVSLQACAALVNSVADLFVALEGNSNKKVGFVTATNYATGSFLLVIHDFNNLRQFHCKSPLSHHLTSLVPL